MIRLRDFFNRSERKMRISVDIDYKQGNGILKAQNAYFFLRNKFSNSKIDVDRTRHGFHVKAVGSEIGKIPIPKRIAIREAMMDDPYRIDHDKRKVELGLPTLVDTLFSLKIHADGSTTIVEPACLTMLPWASRLPAFKNT